MVTYHWARFAQLPGPTLYALLRLRTDVFVVEQRCAYPELDGRDTEPGTRHLWLAPPEQPAQPLAYLRILTEADGSRRIGRVCTAAAHRGTGLAGQLVNAATQTSGIFVLSAQSHLVTFYERFGFRRCGAEHIEDGIPHIPMRRDPRG